MKLIFAFIIIVMSSAVFAQEIATNKGEETAPDTKIYPSNVLYINPVHLSKGNITLSYERFTKPNKSYKVTLSGGEKENYILAAFDVNYYMSPPSLINTFLGLSFTAYESPILTGVPVSRPFYNFSESLEDEYHLGVQVKNGILFRLTKFIYFKIDTAIGPFYNLSEKEWRAVWAINLNLGIPF